MEKKEVHLGECPCGFKFETPHGENDAVAIMKEHVARVHPKDYPQGLTTSQAKEHIRKK